MSDAPQIVWIVLALIAAACVLGMLRAVAASVAHEAAAHDLAIRVAELRIARLAQIREHERRRAEAGAGR